MEVVSNLLTNYIIQSAYSTHPSLFELSVKIRKKYLQKQDKKTKNNTINEYFLVKHVTIDKARSLSVNHRQ